MFLLTMKDLIQFFIKENRFRLQVTRLLFGHRFYDQTGTLDTGVSVAENTTKFGHSEELNGQTCDGIPPVI